MSARTRTATAVSIFLSVLFLPGRIVEEGLHALAAFPFADVVFVEFRPGEGTAETHVQFRETAPEWAIRVAYLLPEAVAWVAGLSVIAWWAVGGAVWLPATTLDWVLLSLLGAQYLAIALPSALDADHTAEEVDE